MALKVPRKLIDRGSDLPKRWSGARPATSLPHQNLHPTQDIAAACGTPAQLQKGAAWQANPDDRGHTMLHKSATGAAPAMTPG